jgi:hypothetical protein
MARLASSVAGCPWGVPRAVTVAPTEIQPAGDGELANAETNREDTSRVAMRGAANTTRPEFGCTEYAKNLSRRPVIGRKSLPEFLVNISYEAEHWQHH